MATPPAKWLLDTNVLSELRRSRPDQRVTSWIEAHPLDDLYISTVNLAEIRFGIETLPDQIRRAELETWLTGKVRPMFTHRVLEITEHIMLRWRLLVEEGRQRGHTYSQPDLIIAATALDHGLALVTRNVNDFNGLGVSLLNPWEG